MLKVFVGCVQLLSLVTLSSKAIGQKTHFRTDGIYVFDNKCDTLFTAAFKDSADEKELLRQWKRMGVHASTANSCGLPANAIVLWGSSYIEGMVFLNDSTAYPLSANCLDSAGYREWMKSINVRINGPVPDPYRCLKFALNDRGVFAERVNLGMAHSKMVGRIYTDRLETATAIITGPFYGNQSVMKPQYKTFRFYKFGQMPPQIIIRAIVRKEPYSWRQDMAMPR